MIGRFFEWILERLLARLWRRHERSVRGNIPMEEINPDDLLKVIIVTTETIPGSMLRCQYQGKWHALIHPHDWEKVKKTIASRPPEMGVSPIHGIPIVRDDELARAVLAGAIAESVEKKIKRQKKARWN